MAGSKQLNLEGAQIGFKNFSGAEGPYNKAGERSFAVFLDEELAHNLKADGWNVKHPKEREFEEGQEDTRQPHLAVSVAFNMYPPKVVLIAGDNTTVLGEGELDILDWAEIKTVDLVLRPYHWSVNGQSGIKAYLKAIYVTIETDAFSNKYGI